jgi:exopolysaccharide production protein ExoY
VFTNLLHAGNNNSLDISYAQFVLGPYTREDAGPAVCSLVAAPAAVVSNLDCGPQSRSQVWRAVERLEQAFAGVLAFCSLPFLLIAAVAVVVLSRRAPFVAHRRVGLAGEEIWIFKVRTMWDAAPGPGWPHSWVEYLGNTPVPDTKQPMDPRVTSGFAVFCRRFSIDELPQLWQVANGTLALIGPRPLTASELDRFYGSSSHTVLQVKPGITGLWQVRGRGRLTYRQRRRLDLFMLRNWSPRLYLRILFTSIPVWLSGKNAF